MHIRHVRRSLVGGLLAVSLLLSPSAKAIDSAVLTALYGEGMKAYYAGQYSQAHETFSQAIEAGSKDPRCFYFRGLSNLRLGRGPDAGLDFQKGAAIEAVDFDVFFNVSGALERIQGTDRLTLERFRAEGRKNAQKEIEKIRFEHYRRFSPQAAVEGAATVEGATPAASGTAPGTVPAAMPGTPGAPAADNPFGGAAPAATPAAPAPAVTNPFGM